ncbi:50S ribosomal protein L25 [Desulfopila sp. IMCC35006]|uniref:50S ribosomal protein L25 n=1 Tax=Desulfopila sp. IMCC35006 TaxID=2569542 RepID=UPI0010AD861A|nr:50S ribosomal protein L25 [Desulfopila sp. IMCC35006]TKB27972.1 50S ribosomal protein L25 [Desulfopila sp. IMCC35006]
MLQVEISASVRNTSGKGPMRQLRMKGMTPAVVYGGGAEAQRLQLDTKTLMAQLLEFYRKNTVVTLNVEGASAKTVMVGEVQTDPVRDTLIHVDFCEIDLQKDRAFTVPVRLTGKAKGVDLGGQMIVGCNQVVLKGKPLDIPDECVVNIAPLAIGEQFTCAALSIPEGVKMITDPATVIISIIKPGEKVEESTEKAVKNGKK